MLSKSVCKCYSKCKIVTSLAVNSRKKCTTGNTRTPSYSIKYLKPKSLTSLSMKGEVDIEQSQEVMSSISYNLFNGMIDNVSNVDAESIVKQLDGSYVSNLLAVEKERCIHGYPRAFVRFPVSTNGAVETVSGGFIRLSCPLLVEAVDKLEGQHLDQNTEKKMDVLLKEFMPKEEGSAVDQMKKRSSHAFNRKDGHGEGIGYFNRLLSSSPELQSNFHDVNKAHCEIRQELVSYASSGRELGGCTALPQTAAKEVSNGMALQSGIAGITQGNVSDVKCLHVHLADYLVRGQSHKSKNSDNCTESGNLIGGAVMRTLEQVMGTDVRGCAACAKQCDPSVSGGKLYGGNKNKLGIRRRRQAYRGGVSSPVGTAM